MKSGVVGQRETAVVGEGAPWLRSFQEEAPWRYTKGTNVSDLVEHEAPCSWQLVFGGFSFLIHKIRAIIH